MDLKTVNTAIKASKRVSGRVPVTLKNYKASLWFLEQWTRKLKLAQTKCKKYRKQVQRYERIFKEDKRGQRTQDEHCS